MSSAGSMARTRVARLLVVALGVGIASGLVSVSVGEAHAQERYLGFKMQASASNRWPYYIDTRAPPPAPLVFEAVESATNTAWRTWEDVACAYPAFRYVGKSDTEPLITDARDPYDSYNVSSVWVTSAQDPYWNFALGNGTSAAASIPTRYGGWLYQCDVYLNGVTYNWSTAATTPPDTLDVQTYVLHEAGHCLGLAHTFNSTSDVMYPGLPEGSSRRALTAFDTDGICGWYPQQGAVGSPCASAACAAGLTCVDVVKADGGTTDRMCSQGCNPMSAVSCPTPYVCKPSAQISGSAGVCQPAAGDSVTPVGKACTQAADCTSAFGVCQGENQPGPLPSGFEAWKGGYCTQQCGQGQPACPLGSKCLAVDGVPLCLQNCRPGTGDCRDGYSCTAAGDEGFVCISACHTDLDCNAGGGSNFICRTCDGTCVPKQNPSGQLGDPCESAATCGLGQVCLKLGSSPTGICSQTCNSACTSCPTGSRCHPVGEVGEYYCLKDCAQGTCGNGQQCSTLATGKACIPPCVTDEECPVGNRCVAGQCVNPFEDGGTCLLCNGSDAGPPPEIPVEEPASPGDEGCNCGSTGLGTLLGAWVSLALWRRASESRRRAS